MKKMFPLILVFCLIVFSIIFYSENETVPAGEESIQSPNSTGVVDRNQNKNSLSQKSFFSPLNRAKERITKKPFGILIDPKTSPVQPENFSGYHTGTDFEIFPEETDKEVPVFAVCAGRILAKKVAMGYGGVLVLSCLLDDQPTTIIYGHLDLKSIEKEVGDEIKTGEKLGLLGAGYSRETYGERKHLHLGVHKGSEVNLTGYVKTKKGLENWLNPCDYFCK